jgi:hypothetical protein
MDPDILETRIVRMFAKSFNDKKKYQLLVNICY